MKDWEDAVDLMGRRVSRRRVSQWRFPDGCVHRQLTGKGAGSPSGRLADDRIVKADRCDAPAGGQPHGPRQVLDPHLKRQAGVALSGEPVVLA